MFILKEVVGVIPAGPGGIGMAVIILLFVALKKNKCTLVSDLQYSLLNVSP